MLLHDAAVASQYHDRIATLLYTSNKCKELHLQVLHRLGSLLRVGIPKFIVIGSD